MNLIHHKFILHIPDFSNNSSYKLSLPFCRSLRTRSSRRSILFSDILCENVELTAKYFYFHDENIQQTVIKI